MSNTLVAFALPDVPRKPLPAAVSKAVAAAAAARRGLPKVGAFAPAVLPPGGAKALVDKTCGTGCHSVEVVTSQRMNAGGLERASCRTWWPAAPRHRTGT